MKEFLEESPHASDTAAAGEGHSVAMAWVGLAAIAGLLLLVLVSGRMLRQPVVRPATGQSLSLIDLEPLTGDGDPVNDDSLQGRVVLINFWGPWCPPCLRELPQLVALQERFADRDDFQLLLVSCSPTWQPLRPPALGWREDVAELRSATARLLDREQYDVPTYVDLKGHTRDALAAIDGWHGYPTTLIFDRTGVIRKVWIGYDAKAEYEMEDYIRLLLNE